MNAAILSSSPQSAACFDQIAARYDDIWTNSPAGRCQRNAVWRHLDPLVRTGHRALDIACGTGEDALHLARLGAQVLAVDSSSEMVRTARAKGVNAHVLPIEGLQTLSGSFDLVVSNFGGLNCIQDLSSLREPLSRLVRPDGRLAICLMGRFCFRESFHFFLRGQFRKAARRWRGETTASTGLRVFYPTATHVRRSFLPDFDFVADVGLGISVPPSFIRASSSHLLDKLASVDACVEASRIGRAIGDHRLFIFRRSK